MRALLMVHGYDPVTGAPDPIPDGWTVARIGGAEPWFAVTHPSGREVWCWRENEDGTGTRALWAIFGDAADLAELAAIVDRSMPAREAWRRRTEDAIRERLLYWRTVRCDGFERDTEGNAVAFTGEVRTLVPRGVQLPDPVTNPLPWDLAADGSLTTQANAERRVTGFAGANTLALAITLAGHGYPTAFADEEDPGT